MTTLGTSLGIGGGVLSAAGGFLAGQAANRGARQTRDFGLREFRRLSGPLGSLLLGPGYGQLGALGLQQARARHSGDQELVGQLQGQIDNTIQNRFGGSVFDQQRQLAGRASRRSGQILSDYDRDTTSLQGGYGALQASTQGGYDEAIREARQFGAGQANRIRRDAASARTSSRRRLSSRFASQGIDPSSVMGQQMLAGQNERIGRTEQDSLLDLNSANIDRVLPLLMQRANVGQQIGGMSQGMLAGRSSGRTALQEGGLLRQLALQQAPIQTQASSLQQLIASNPMIQGRFPQAGQSALGNALGGFGNTLTALGGHALGRNR